MSDKERTLMQKIEGVMEHMDDNELEKFLLVGEGMVIMAGIKDEKSENRRERKKEVV